MKKALKVAAYCLILGVLLSGIVLGVYNWPDKPPAVSVAPTAASVAVGAASPHHLAPVMHRRPPLSAALAPKPRVDTRTPQQVSQAACSGVTGWSCKLRKTVSYGATNPSSGTTPATWGVPNWFVDDANVTTCASDQNNGTSATCGSTGIGPLQHKKELVRRWGTDQPTLDNIDVVVTYLSSDPDTTDPGHFQPRMIETATFTETAALPTATFTGTLNVVTHKAFSPLPGNALSTTFTVGTGAVAANMLLVNSTHPSHAIAQRILSGSNWQISQPLVAYAGGFPIQTLVDTWASGDTIHGYVPISVNLTQVGGIASDLNQSTFGPNRILSQVTIPLLGGAVFQPMQLDFGSNLFVTDVVFSRAVTGSGNEPVSFFSILQNCVEEEQSVIYTRAVEYAGGIVNNGGPFALDAFSNDVILAGDFNAVASDLDDAEVFLDTGTDFEAHGFTFVAGGSVLGKIYGPGTYTQYDGLTGYHETASDHFFSPMTINGSTTACALDTSGDPALVHCGRLITGALLDTSVASGGFGGTAFIPGIGAIGPTN